MTTPVSGSSLPQARDVHQHNHFHHARDSHHSHLHTHHKHHHARSSHDRSDHQHNQQHHQQRRASTSKRGHKRADSHPTTIVETVSVLQLIDSTGGVLTLQTLSNSKPASVLPATTTSDATVVVPTSATASATLGSLTSSYPGTSGDDEGDGSQSLSVSLSSSAIGSPAVTPSESSMPTTSFPTLSYSPLTSAPLSGNPVFPSLAGVTNTTQAVPTSLFNNSTTSSIQQFSAESLNTSSSSDLVSILSISSSSLLSSEATTTSSFESSSSAFSSSRTSSATSTGGSTFGVGGNAQSSATNTAAAGADDGSSDGPGAATVAGSVIGGVAALAFILILALGLLRWKKRQNTLKLMRGSTNERGPAGGLVGNSGPGGGPGGAGYGAMAERRRRSIPFAIPAALASLTGHNRFSGRSAATVDDGERGFSKVSGRKLPPVIQFGGDGYTDPRDTMQSDQSIDYRDSQAFPGLMGAAGPTRLALGAPMRPDSGIPVFNSGPARTPVQEQGPFLFATNSPSPALAPPRRDPLGRSLPSHDGSVRSHASASRFTEEFK